MVVGALYRPLHPKAWKLAQPGRDPDWSLQPPVPRKTQNRGYRHSAPPSQSLESQCKPPQDHHQVEVHKKARTSETKLLIHAVTVLADRNLSSPGFDQRLGVAAGEFFATKLDSTLPLLLIGY